MHVIHLISGVSTWSLTLTNICLVFPKISSTVICTTTTDILYDNYRYPQVRLESCQRDIKLWLLDLFLSLFSDSYYPISSVTSAPEDHGYSLFIPSLIPSTQRFLQFLWLFWGRDAMSLQVLPEEHYRETLSNFADTAFCRLLQHRWYQWATTSSILHFEAFSWSNYLLICYPSNPHTHEHTWPISELMPWLLWHLAQNPVTWGMLMWLSCPYFNQRASVWPLHPRESWKIIINHVDSVSSLPNCSVTSRVELNSDF